MLGCYVVVQTLCSSGRGWELGLAFPSQLYSAVPRMKWRVSQPLLLDLMWLFSSVWCVGITQLVSGFLSEGIALCVAVHLVYPNEGWGSSGPFYVASLVPSLIWSRSFFFFWPRCTACGILIPWPGIEPRPPAVEARSPNHWTAREFPHMNQILMGNHSFIGCIWKSQKYILF